MYTQDEKSTGLDTLGSLAAGDLIIVGDVSDLGRAKGITRTDFGATISQDIDITNIETGVLDPAHGGTGVNGFAAVKGDLIVGSGPGTFTLLNVGAEGTVLTSNSAAPNGLLWIPSIGGGGGGGAGTKIAIDTTSTTVNSGTTAIFTVVIPAATLGSNDAIRFKVLLSSLNISGGSSVAANLKYGGTIIGTTSFIGVGGGGLNGDAVLFGEIIAHNATSAQKGVITGVMIVDESGDNSPVKSDYGTSAIDSTVNQNLVIELSISGTASAVAQAIVVEKIVSGSSITTYFTKPVGIVTGGEGNINFNDNTKMYMGLINIPHEITVSSLSVYVETFTGAGTISISLFSEDGQTRLINANTASIGSTGVKTTSITAKTIPAGNYYLAVHTNGSTNIQIRDVAVNNNLLEPSGMAISAGVVTITASTTPSTIDPTSDIIFDAQGNTLVRFDT